MYRIVSSRSMREVRAKILPQTPQPPPHGAGKTRQRANAQKGQRSGTFPSRGVHKGVKEGVREGVKEKHDQQGETSGSPKQFEDRTTHLRRVPKTHAAPQVKSQSTNTANGTLPPMRPPRQPIRHLAKITRRSRQPAHRRHEWQVLARW